MNDCASGADEQVFGLLCQAGNAEQELFGVAVVSVVAGVVQGRLHVGGELVRPDRSDERTCQGDQFPVTACLSELSCLLDRSPGFSTFGLLLSSQTLCGRVTLGALVHSTIGVC
ncbi:MAG: hypothetical protein O3C40_24710 [Planctomycetota bacterium]|nr:hypothetical protein [Planctomycetota bacterium]